MPNERSHSQASLDPFGDSRRGHDRATGGSGRSQSTVDRRERRLDPVETAIKETILDGHRVRLRAYNGQIPGPTMTVVPGQTLRIRLKNSLPPYDSSKWGGDHNVPHGLDAEGHRSSRAWLGALPHIFEPLGFDFYHPHKHGATAVHPAR